MSYFWAVLTAIAGAVIMAVAVVLITLVAIALVRDDPDIKAAVGLSVFYTVPPAVLVGFILGLWLSLA